MQDIMSIVLKDVDLSLSLPLRLVSSQWNLFVLNRFEMIAREYIHLSEFKSLKLCNDNGDVDPVKIVKIVLFIRGNTLRIAMEHDHACWVTVNVLIASDVIDRYDFLEFFADVTQENCLRFFESKNIQKRDHFEVEFHVKSAGPDERMPVEVARCLRGVLEMEKCLDLKRFIISPYETKISDYLYVRPYSLMTKSEKSNSKSEIRLPVEAKLTIQQHGYENFRWVPLTLLARGRTPKNALMAYGSEGIPIEQFISISKEQFADRPKILELLVQTDHYPNFEAIQTRYHTCIACQTPLLMTFYWSSTSHHHFEGYCTHCKFFIHAVN